MSKRYLISRLSALGDVVCSLPAATALKKSDPDCKIVWAVDPRFAGIVECCKSVDEVIPCSVGFNPGTWPRFEGTFDCALDLQGLLKSAIPIARAKAGLKLGYNWQREGSWLFSRQVLPDPTSCHVVDQYVDVARAAGGSADKADFALQPKTDDLNAVFALLKESGVSGKFVALNPGAGWETKRWPADRFGALANKLYESGVPSVLIGGNSSVDHASADQVMATAKNAIKLTGKTSVRQLVALLSIASAHVGGDTGSSHIAAALGVPAIGLYSITRPQRSCPYGQISRCIYNPNSLSEITCEEVYDKVEEAMS